MISENGPSPFSIALWNVTNTGIQWLDWFGTEDPLYIDVKKPIKAHINFRAHVHRRKSWTEWLGDVGGSSLSWSYPKLAGCFLFGKIPWKFRWWLGVPLWRNGNLWSATLKTPSSTPKVKGSGFRSALSKTSGSETSRLAQKSNHMVFWCILPSIFSFSSGNRCFQIPAIFSDQLEHHVLHCILGGSSHGS